MKFDRFPAIADYFDRLQKRPSVAKAFGEELALYKAEQARHKQAAYGGPLQQTSAHPARRVSSRRVGKGARRAPCPPSVQRRARPAAPRRNSLLPYGWTWPSHLIGAAGHRIRKARKVCVIPNRGVAAFRA